MRASRNEPIGAAPAALHGADESAMERVVRPRRGGFLASVMLVVLTLGLFAATAGCLAVAGLGLAVWPPAMIDALAEHALLGRAWPLAGAIAAPLGVVGLVHQSWRAFSRARTARCADFMLLALGAALGIYFVLFAPVL